MSTARVDELLRLLGQAFEGDWEREHSLLSNLRSVTDEDFRRRIDRGRSIEQIFVHAAWAKYVYASHAFGDGSVNWGHLELARTGQEPMDETVDWAREGHRRFVEGLRALTDAQLDEPRATHWSPPQPARDIVGLIIRHDIYHAGEINHLRALLQDNDHWNFHE